MGIPLFTTTQRGHSKILESKGACFVKRVSDDFNETIHIGE